MPRAFILAVPAAALALAACNSATSNNIASAPVQNIAATVAPAAPAPQPAPPGGNDLAAQLQAELQTVQPMLPIRVDQVSQITAVHLEDTEVVYTMRYAVPISDLDRVRREAQAHAQTNVCANAPAAALIRRGVTMRYDYSDSVGVTFHTRVAACP